MDVRRLNKLRGIYPPAVPPAGSESTGKKTPGGDEIFRRRIQPTKKVRAVDENGKPKSRGGNPLTGEEGVPVFRYVKDGPERWEHFYISRGRHGNNRLVRIDPDALAAEKERKAALVKKDELLQLVAERAVASGMNIRDAVDRILGLGQPEPEETEPEFVSGMTVEGGESEPEEADADYEAARDAAESSFTRAPSEADADYDEQV